MTDRIQLYVGTAPNNTDLEAQMVLEYSARKYCSIPIDIHWMCLTNDTNSFWHGWETPTWPTPFSGYRWGIPAACDYKGKAIYCDHDFIFLDDLAKLWNQEFEPGKIAMVKGGSEGWRTCIMMWNNEEAKNHLPPIDRMKSNLFGHRRLIGWLTSQNRHLCQFFDGSWNTVDGENLSIEDIQGLHYSDMSSQLHAKLALARLKETGGEHWYNGVFNTHWRTDLVDLFNRYYKEALEAGYKLEDYYREEFVDYQKESLEGYGSRPVHSWVGR